MIVDIIGNKGRQDMLLTDYADKRYHGVTFKDKNDRYFLVGYFTGKGVCWDWMERNELCLRPKHAYKSKREAIEEYINEENVEFRYFDWVSDLFEWLQRS